jgi:hypothetical protein
LILDLSDLIIIRQNQSTTGNCENRNDPDLVQAFLKKWWVESDFKGSLYQSNSRGVAIWIKKNVEFKLISICINGADM